MLDLEKQKAVEDAFNHYINYELNEINSDNSDKIMQILAYIENSSKEKLTKSEIEDNKTAFKRAILTIHNAGRDNELFGKMKGLTGAVNAKNEADINNVLESILILGYGVNLSDYGWKFDSLNEYLQKTYPREKSNNNKYLFNLKKFYEHRLENSHLATKLSVFLLQNNITTDNFFAKQDEVKHAIEFFKEYFKPDNSISLKNVERIDGTLWLSLYQTEKAVDALISKKGLELKTGLQNNTSVWPLYEEGSSHYYEGSLENTDVNLNVKAAGALGNLLKKLNAGGGNNWTDFAEFFNDKMEQKNALFDLDDQLIRNVAFNALINLFPESFDDYNIKNAVKAEAKSILASAIQNRGENIPLQSVFEKGYAVAADFAEILNASASGLGFSYDEMLTNAFINGGFKVNISDAHENEPVKEKRGLFKKALKKSNQTEKSFNDRFVGLLAKSVRETKKPIKYDITRINETAPINLTPIVEKSIDEAVVPPVSADDSARNIANPERDKAPAAEIMPDSGADESPANEDVISGQPAELLEVVPENPPVVTENSEQLNKSLIEKVENFIKKYEEGESRFNFKELENMHNTFEGLLNNKANELGESITRKLESLLENIKESLKSIQAAPVTVEHEAVPVGLTGAGGEVSGKNAQTFQHANFSIGNNSPTTIIFTDDGSVTSLGQGEAKLPDAKLKAGGQLVACQIRIEKELKQIWGLSLTGYKAIVAHFKYDENEKDPQIIFEMFKSFMRDCDLRNKADLKKLLGLKGKNTDEIIDENFVAYVKTRDNNLSI